MYSNSDFEKLWFLNKTEGEPKGISINSFCVTQGVPYNQFNNWFRKTHKKIVPEQIDDLYDIDHLCCMAHVRAKFKYAYEQGHDARAKYFLDKIGWLYNQEKKYRELGLTAGEIEERRLIK